MKSRKIKLFLRNTLFGSIIFIFSILSIVHFMAKKDRYSTKLNYPNAYNFYTQLIYFVNHIRSSTKSYVENLRDYSIKSKRESEILNNPNEGLIYNKKDKETLESFWHQINVDTINAKEYLYDWYLESGLPGGYIEVLNDEKIIGTNAKGEMFIFSRNDNGLSKVNSNLNKIYKKQNYKGKITPQYVGAFSVKDIFYDKTNEKLLASILHESKDGKPCYGMAIYEAKMPLSFNEKSNLDFQLYFRTEKCNSHFNGHASGGRIKRMNDNIIFTIGDLDHNLKGDRKIPQSSSTAIGKIIAIKPNKDFEVLSMGHRNPQGLTILNDRIFITEHGPTGGDEINFIPGNKSHFGWPFFAYGFGSDYSIIEKDKGRESYEESLFYFSPSIGISEIIYYKGKEFPYWEDKFIVLSMKDKSFFLLDYDKDKNRIISSERIYIGHRLRDISIYPDGKIILITDDKKILYLSNNNTDN